MNLKHLNEPALPATVPQILARLILVQQNNELPDPNDLRVRLDRRQIDVTVPEVKDVNAWAEALGCKGDVVTSKGTVSGVTNCWVTLPSWHGWKVEIEAREAPTPKSTLDADTVTGLEEVAGEPKPAQIPAERVNEILAELNRLSQDPDGNGREPDWWDWIADAVPEFDAEATADSNNPLVLHLTDGTVFAWERQSKAWAVSA